MPILFILLGGLLGAGGVLGVQALSGPKRQFLAFFVSEEVAPPTRGVLFDTFDEAKAFARELLEDRRASVGSAAWVVETENGEILPQKAFRLVKSGQAQRMENFIYRN